MFYLLDDVTGTEVSDFAAAIEDDLANRHRKQLLCAPCKSVVTDELYASQIQGRHEHDKINPHGYEFRFRIFSDAPGIADVGVPTHDVSWFAGFAWLIGCCGTCGAQLGWHFRDGSGDGFYGLISDRLIEEQEE